MPVLDGFIGRKQEVKNRNVFLFLLAKGRMWLLVVTLLSLCQTVHAEQQGKALEFNAQGKFKIVQITDVHWNNAALEHNKKYQKVFASILDEEKPALVVFTGDVITSSPVDKGWHEVLKPVVNRKIPWTATLGNHDEEHNLKRAEIIALLEKLPGSLVQPGPKDVGGCGNHDLAVKASSGNADAAMLYFMDSNAKSLIENTGDYDWIKFAQINWYRQKSRQHSLANNAKPLPSLMFFHIPLPR